MPNSDSVPVDLPVQTDPGHALEIAAKLDAGEDVEMVINEDVAPDLADRLRWQVQNQTQLMEIVDEFPGDDEVSEA
jgi:hypothetical protein